MESRKAWRWGTSRVVFVVVGRDGPAYRANPAVAHIDFSGTRRSLCPVIRGCFVWFSRLDCEHLDMRLSSLGTVEKVALAPRNTLS